MGKTKKILLVQTANSNLGDSVIANNHEYLLRKMSGFSKIRVFNYSISSRDVGQIKYADAVVFAGGILKITNEKFHIYIPEIIRTAQEYNVPVFLSSIGVEQFYSEDERSRELKEAINLPCVKGFSIRDDIDTFMADYLAEGSRAAVSPVYDVAVWSSKTYSGILANDSAKKPLIGLGIVRHKLFSDYGHPEITKEIQMDFWLGVIRELDERGLDWVIFTNGDRYDEAMACEVLENAGHGRKLPSPLDSEELVRNISTFTGVIAGRMHSVIISYALGIPNVGIIWNRKLRFWAEKTGRTEYFMETSGLNPANAVSLLSDALTKPCGPDKNILKTVYAPLEHFIKKEVHGRRFSMGFSSPISTDTYCADHLGSIKTRYPGTDSPEALKAAYASGCRNFRIDLRLTSDGTLVCVNRWYDKTYNALGYTTREEEIPTGPISLDKFLSLKYFDRFSTVTFAELWDEIEKLKKPCRFILSFGLPSDENTEEILSQASEVIRKHPDSRHDVIFSSERYRDFDVIRSYLPGIKYMYHYVPKEETKADPMLLEERYKKALESVVKHNLDAIAVGSAVWDPSRLKAAHKKGLKFCLFTDNTVDMIYEASKEGADIIIADTYMPDYLINLTKGKMPR